MCEHLGVSSLRFVTIDGLYRACGIDKGRSKSCPEYCDACFTGEYPVRPVDQIKHGFKLKELA